MINPLPFDAPAVRWAVLSLGLMATLGCSQQATRAPQTSPEVVELEQRLLEAEKRAVVGEIESARLRRRVHELEERLATRQGGQPATDGSASTASAARAPHLPAPRTVDNRPPATDSVAEELPPPVSTTIEVEDLEDQVLEEELANEARRAAEEPAAAEPVAAGPTAAPVGEQPQPTATAATPPDDATFAAYDDAYVLFHQKRYRQAEEKFQAFVARYPSSELTDNAQFWIGESRYARKDYAGALEAFSATVADYPGGNKVPDALLKAGKCLEALGRNDQARQTYLEIQRRFAGTAVAIAAEERLAALASTAGSAQP